MSTNQIVNQTSQDLVQLATLARSIGDRMFFLQVERLKSEFETSLKRYSGLQQVWKHLFIYKFFKLLSGILLTKIDRMLLRKWSP